MLDCFALVIFSSCPIFIQRTRYSSLSKSSGDPRDLRSFPTRRSSDLRRLDGGHWRVVHPGTHGFFESPARVAAVPDRKSTRLNSSHRCISYACFFLQKLIPRLMNSRILMVFVY